MARLLCFVALLLVALTEATYEITDLGKKCMTEVGITEDEIRKLSLIEEQEILDKDDIKKFILCRFDKYVTDTNELNDEDGLIEDLTDILERKYDLTEKLAKLITKKCVDECKGLKGDTKDLTIIKSTTCFFGKVDELLIKKD